MNLSLVVVVLLMVMILPLSIWLVFPKRKLKKNVQLNEPWVIKPYMQKQQEHWETEEYVSPSRVIVPAPTEESLSEISMSKRVDSVLTHPPVNLKSTDRDPLRHLPTQDNLNIIYIMAKPGKKFVGYELFQALLNAGFRFGPMQIFHRYLDEDENSPILFSLASAVEPGVFDLQQIGGFSTQGLSLFMDGNRVSNPDQTLQLMIETAEQLAEDLGGELKDSQHNPLDTDTSKFQ